MRRANARSSAVASTCSTAVVFSADSIRTRFIGSNRAGSLPCSAGPTCQTRMKSGKSRSPSQGGVASSTECPSSVSRDAASSAAVTQAASTGASIGGKVVTATRSRPGSPPTSSAKGRWGGGAQYGSPVS